ncbi:MAG: cell division protein ZipA [Lysobacterales bacterium]|jgi:cell division protein ZipA
MDITTFRWILVIVGLIIVAGIFLLGKPDNRRRPRASRKRTKPERQKREPKLFGSGGREEPGDGQHADDGEQTELPIGSARAGDDRVEPSLGPAEERQDEPPQPLPDKIVTLFIQARDNHLITGVELLDVAIKAGLVFGYRDIFHRIDENDDNDPPRPLFSMANLTKPGTFNKTSWSTLETHGVTVFMTLPGPRAALDAWDAMLATSRRLAELLHADLLDESRRPLTRERTLEIKEELREYDRRANEPS